MASSTGFSPTVCVVGFHHARGPEIESWFGVEEGTDPAVDNDWNFLPFMALSDGAHTATEDFSYFTLRQLKTPGHPATSRFGISCTRQLDARELLNRPDDVTRSTVQKSLVVIAESPHCFGHLREKLSMVTRAWFAQKDFTDVEILKEFQESLASSLQDADDEQYLGLSLREFIHEFKHQTLVLFKCCLLQPKMLFFGSRCERLCMMQFSLISLIPGLIRRLEDSADPEMENYERNMTRPTSLKTSERSSLLAYMGLPLQIFGRGSLFGPYTPLQQLDMLADYGTKSYIVGSTNSLLLQQKDRYSDILINLDESTITTTSSSLRSALALSAADRRWIDFLTQTITQTWDPEHPSRPKTHGYLGSEEFIRLQFEEYLLALLAAVKYHKYLYAVPHHLRDLSAFPDIDGDPSVDFNETWVEAWKTTGSFRIWDKFTENHLFDIVEPRHPTAGGLSIEDINRRLTQQIQELKLDERLVQSRDVLNKHLATSHKKVSTAFNNLWADIETLREAQRARHADARAKDLPSAANPLSPLGQAGGLTSPSSPRSDVGLLPSPSRFSYDAEGRSPATPGRGFDTAALRARAPDLSHAQAAVGAVGVKAGAYISSWGAWAAERRRGWGKPSANKGEIEGGGRKEGEWIGEGENVGGGVGGANNGAEKDVGEENGGASNGRGAVGVGAGVKAQTAEARRSERNREDKDKVPPMVSSPRKAVGRKKSSREIIGGDGIGRLDA
ncbi:late secretory pathway protein avl9 [Trapelia coarctata]|nr:late secretory pathway protein avl9 [Trapelia coarctata]